MSTGALKTSHKNCINLIKQLISTSREHIKIEYNYQKCNFRKFHNTPCSTCWGFICYHNRGLKSLGHLCSLTNCMRARFATEV